MIRVEVRFINLSNGKDKRHRYKKFFEKLLIRSYKSIVHTYTKMKAYGTKFCAMLKFIKIRITF